MTGTVAELAHTSSQLNYLPVGLVGSVMGLTGPNCAP
jgi:hypothetical protein